MELTKNEIIKGLTGLSDSDLREINSAVIEELKFIRDRDARTKRFTLQAGDQVQFNGRRGLTVGEIIRIKRKKAIVKVGFQNWDVPLSMLTKV